MARASQAAPVRFSPAQGHAASGRATNVDGVSVLLRTAEDPDVAAVGALHHRSRSTAYAGLVSPAALAVGLPSAMSQWWTERRRWEGDTHRLTVAVAGEAVVGFSYVGPSETPDAVELYALYVEPTLIGTGLGRLLMGRALTDLRPLAAGRAKRAVLWVLTGNVRARRFYERGGWFADGTSRSAPIGSVTVPQLRYTREFNASPH